MSDALRLAHRRSDRFARDPSLGAQRSWPRESALDRALMRLLSGVQGALGAARRRPLRAVVAAVDAAEAECRGLDDAALRIRAREIGRAGRCCDPTALAHVGPAFALVREAARRHLGLRHHPVQLMGGYALVRGLVAEMQTGEGKTLTATLAAAAMALAGHPTHVVTVNDYLARRDAEEMGPIYRALGLEVGIVVAGASPEERREAYGADITYCCNKELVFDYLRDRAAGAEEGRLPARAAFLAARGSRPAPLVRGLSFAIVDEADSVLVDEARTPLILSGEGPPLFDPELLRAAAGLAQGLERGRHFVEHALERRIELNDRGATRLARQAADGILGNRVLREELVVKALSAEHLFERDVHYLIADGAVRIIDEYSGRVMADRFWTEGLQQAIELKEGVSLTRGRKTLARMTYQRFFRRYERLSGMTGTAREVAAELYRVYRLPVVPVATHRPVRRAVLPTRVHATLDAKWEAIAAEAAGLSERGIPVLIGTRSVSASLQASRALARRGVDHEVLSAAQDAEEARKIGEAGQRGRVTVATNMAGRGADIKLGDGVAALGGLHVLMSECHDSARIDRQLAGRAGRQGEPGSFRAVLSREDPLLRTAGSLLVRALACAPPNGSAVLAHRLAQRRAESRHARMRRDLLRQDEVYNDAMGFSGSPD